MKFTSTGMKPVPIARVMEMSTDITEIRELQDHLSSLGLKISSISHGIKSLLAELDGGIYLVELGLSKDDPDRVKDGWDAVKTIVSRIRKLVLNILFFSSKGNKGTGLGLFIANKIMEQHDGKIKVNSKPNRGSSFRITILKTPSGSA